ncbi:hypothetical protein BOTNAR_0313g00080 [Botryotinia narcissicola]|uniref:Uncharacterized protein n=1 Tax=Botryotinia narcissicola TaxID=278944 RepID=A0A4Z1HUS0_9HELO|nr:hypothetical protein BOTNAR_0313g00080 [Botryotinia narcissicola]
MYTSTIGDHLTSTIDTRDPLDSISSRLFASISSGGVAVWGLVPSLERIYEGRAEREQRTWDKLDKNDGQRETA